MATLQQEVSQLIKIAVANQPAYIYSELRKRGYSNPLMPPAGELESKLYELYASNKEDFYSVMTNLPFDSTRTDSLNSSQVAVDLATELGYAGSTARFNVGQAWDWLVKTVAGHEESTVGGTTTTMTTPNVAAIIGLSIVAIAAIVFAYLAFFRK